MSRRHEQFNATLQRALGKVITTRLNDPRLAGMITVTRAEVSPDFRHAAVGVSVLPEKYEQRTLHGLRHAARHIQSLLHSEMRTRTMPQLHFELDRSLKKQAEMLDVIRKAVDSGRSTPPAGPEGEGGGEAEADSSEAYDRSPSDSSPPAPEDPEP